MESGGEPKRKNEKSSNAGLVVLAVFGLLFGLTGSGLGAIAILNNSRGAEISSVISSDFSNSSVVFQENSVSDVVAKVTPAVVSIVGEAQQTTGFFRTTTSTVQTAGTGMIVTSDGYVLTNKHVIDGVERLEIIADDGTVYSDVSIVGTDPSNDIAYLKINGVSDLPTVELGDSKTIILGQSVLAIGNAQGMYQNSVTQGIIGGTGRSITASDSNGSNVEELTDMIQTDAAINPGNSGGPLVNAAGQVIGINTAVDTDSQGIGFAIPISAAKGMLKSIIENGKAEKAFIGISYLTITPDSGMSVTRGAYVHLDGKSSPIQSGSPAEKAGIREGDIITHINGAEVGKVGSLASLVGEYKPGDTIQITILRDDKTITVNLVLDAYPE